MFSCYSSMGLLIDRIRNIETAVTWPQFHFAIYEPCHDPATELEQLCEALSTNGRDVSLRKIGNRWACSLIGRGDSPAAAVRAAADLPFGSAEEIQHVMMEVAA